MEITHGTYTAYTTRSCRCDDCKQAMKDYRQSLKAQGLPEGDRRHGTRNGYYNYGCRCEGCSEAARKYSRSRVESGAIRRGYLTRTYDLSPGDWDELWQSQGEVCASCGDAPLPDSKRRFHVDHNHTTGEVRGILCHGCNVALGLLKEDPERIRALAAYIESYQPF